MNPAEVLLAWQGGAQVSTSVLAACPNYGHFTTFQVRAGAVQGLALHLARLQQAHAALFDGHMLADDQVLARIAQALATYGATDATVRIAFVAASVAASGRDALCSLSVQAPRAVPTAAWRVQPAIGARAWPQLKHLGTFAQLHQAGLARCAGYDDALLVQADGLVLEGTAWNIGFVGRDGLVWPDGPALRGVTERLLGTALAATGGRQVRRAVHLEALGGFQGAFACNARGLWPLIQVGGVQYPQAEACVAPLARLLAAQPWTPLAV